MHILRALVEAFFFPNFTFREFARIFLFYNTNSDLYSNSVFLFFF